MGGGEGDGWIEPYVKVLYNGENWTPRLACARVAIANGNGVPSLACSLAAFQAQIAQLIAPHATWEDACFTTEPHVKHVEGHNHAHPTKITPAAAAAAAGSDVSFSTIVVAAASTEPEDELINDDVGPSRAVDEDSDDNGGVAV